MSDFFGNASERLAFVLSVDANGAIRGFGQFRVSAGRDLDEVQSKIDRTASRMQAFGAGAVAFAGVAGRALFSLGQDASDLAEVVSKNGVIFGEFAGRVEDFADTAAESLGQSRRAALEAATQFGNLFTAMGLSTETAADMSVELTTLASDLASFNNTSPEEAVLALGAALRGEAEPIRRYGVLLDEATLKQQALDLGLVESTTGTLPPAIRAQAAYAVILEQTTSAQGDFARTSDGAANQQRILAAQMENLKAAIGEGVLPVMTQMVSAANSAVGAFNSLDTGTKAAIGSFAAYTTAGVGAVGALSFAAGSLAKMRTRFLEVDKATGQTTGGLNKFGKAAAGLGAAGVLAGIATGLKEINDASNTLTVSLDDMRAATDAHLDSLAAAVPTLEAMGIGVEEWATALAQESIPQAERFAEALERQGRDAGFVRDAIDEARGAHQRAVTDTNAHQEALGEVNETLDATPRAVGRASTAYDAFIRKQGELEGAIEDVIDAQRELFSGRRSERRALLDLHDAQDRLTEVNADGEATDRDRERALLDLQEAQEQYGEAVRERAEQEEIANGNVATAAEVAARRQIEALLQVAAALAPGSPTRVYLEEYIRLLDEAARPRQAQLTIRLRQVADDVGAHPGMMSPEGPSRAPRVVAGDDVRQKSVTVNAYGVGTAEVSQQIARDLTWEIN